MRFPIQQLCLRRWFSDMDSTSVGVNKKTSERNAVSLGVIGVSKCFGELQALDDVSMQVDAGSFHCLLGENGAGKSTLVKCLVGYYRPEQGNFLIDGREYEVRNPRDAQHLGIGMVYQHFTLAPGLTVAENLLLARGDLPFVLDWRREKTSLSEFMAQMPFRLELGAQVADLAAGEKQKLEILKQLYLRRRLLILDEPTSVLTPAEADEVLGMLHGMTRAGQLTVLMITHKFREVTAYGDVVTVLRRGRLAGTGRVDSTSIEQMAEMMVGTHINVAVERSPGRMPVAEPGSVRLQIEALQAENDRGTSAIQQFALQVRAGEMVGIAGVSGNGQKELIEVLLGQRAAISGNILVDGVPYQAARAQMRQHGVYSLPEEPLKNACVPDMSVAENMALRNFDLPPVNLGWKAGWYVRSGQLNRRARELVEMFGVRPADPSLPIVSLSGGNVQRAVLARELAQPVRLLIVANPVFGLDFAATEAIHRRLDEARNGGAAILLVSEDLDELLELSDRILVMSEGAIVYEVMADSADRAVIGRYMAGHETHDKELVC